MTKKIMPVFTDGGAANVVIPIVGELVSDGYEILPVVEGLGANRWPETWPKPIFRGTHDYRTIPFSLDVEALLKHYRPDVVIVGESFPNHLEGQFARVAQQMGISVVPVGDFWGGFVRLGLTKSPDLILGLDEYDVRLVHDRFPEASVIVMGNLGVSKESIVPVPELLALRASGHLVITLCGGGPETTEQIELLLKCLAVTEREYKLILRWHPGERNLPDPEHNNRPYQETWDTLLVPFGDRVVRVDEASAESVVTNSDIVCSGYSTLLTFAAQVGATAVSLATPQVERMLQEESAAWEIPQVQLGLAHRVDKPTDLAQLQPCPEEIRVRLKPFNPVVGAEAICVLLERR